MNIKLIFLLILLSWNIHGQIANFPFNSSVNDTSNGYSPTVFGNPTLESEDGLQALKLEGDEFLSLPNAIHQSINPDEDVEIHIKFKVTDTYLDTPYAGTGEFGEEGRRVLVSNRYFDSYELGFDIFTQYDGDELRLMMSFGDGDNGGQTIWNVTIGEDEWVDLRMTMRLNNPRPSIVFKLNGFYNHTTLVPMYLNTEILRAALNTQQIWVGTAMDDDLQWYDYAYAEVLIDYLAIYNPPYSGNTSLVANALEAMKNHLNGSAPLAEATQQANLTLIVEEWDDNTYNILSSEILDYITTYETEEGTVFAFYTEYIDPTDVDAPKALQFMLIQYFLDNLYTNDNASSMSGISFLEHEIMPGPVAASAPRITETVTLDGDYNTDPGFFLNMSAFVIRPTGYYAAPGELVTITLPATLINQGVNIHVGAHFVDIREDFRGYQRFPTLATKFPVDNSTMTVANPLGGAIYLTLPDGSNFGSIAMTVSNAVKSPYYSTKTGYANSLIQYQTDISNAYVNWVDLESNNFQATFPRALAEIETDANLILDPMNAIVAQFNIMAGRPSEKIRSEYMISEPQSYTQGTYPASYPISIPNGDLNESDPQALPVSVIDPDLFIQTYDATTLVHELGHLHGLPTMEEEWETNIDVPNVMAFNTVFNMPIDTALYYSSGFQFLDGNQAALDWILDPKFRKGEATDYQDVSYQLRGVAKYTDVGRLFSWDTLGLIHQYWYDAQLDLGEPSEGSWFLTSDEFIQAASDQVDFNFAPLWHLWGNIPSESQISALDNYTKEDRIKERILHYRSLVPSNLAEYQSVHSAITPNIEDHHKVRYNDMLSYYNETVADSIFSTIDNILCTYYDTNCELSSIDVELDASSITLLPNPTDGIFEITGLMEAYTVSIIGPDGSILRSIQCSGNSHFVDLADLPNGLHFVKITNENNALISLEKIIKQ